MNTIPSFFTETPNKAAHADLYFFIYKQPYSQDIIQSNKYFRVRLQMVCFYCRKRFHIRNKGHFVGKR